MCVSFTAARARAHGLLNSTPRYINGCKHTQAVSVLCVGSTIKSQLDYERAHFHKHTHTHTHKSQHTNPGAAFVQCTCGAQCRISVEIEKRRARASTLYALCVYIVRIFMFVYLRIIAQWLCACSCRACSGESFPHAMLICVRVSWVRTLCI